MRMWMVKPRLLCRNHLLGQHRELHTLVGTLRAGKSLAGHLERGQLQPQSLRKYHKKVVKEMKRRGYNHHTPLTAADLEGLDLPYGKVSKRKSLKDLRKRCNDCRERQDRDKAN